MVIGRGEGARGGGSQGISYLVYHFLRAIPSFIFVRPSTVCNCYTCTRPNAAMAHGFHKFHSFSLFNIEKFCAVSWATMGGQARGEPYHGRCRALGIRPSVRPSCVGPTNRFRYCRDGISDRWEPLARMARRSLIPSRSHPNPRPRRSSHPRSTSTEPVRPSVVMVGIKLFDNALFAQENCA